MVKINAVLLYMSGIIQRWCISCPEVKDVVGWLEIEERRGHRPLLEQREVLGLPLLRVALPICAGLGERAYRRRIKRGGAAFSRCGVRRVLTAEGVDPWELFAQWGLCPVDSTPLCQAMAASLTLAALAADGILPEQAVVTLRAVRVSRPLFQAAEQLCPRVRGLIVDAPAGGAALGEYLRREYGVPLLEGGSPHVEVQFAPVEGAGDGGIRLWGAQPDLRGLALGLPPELELSGINPLTLATLLWEEGRLDVEDIEIFSTDGNSIGLDRTGQTTYNTKIM